MEETNCYIKGSDNIELYCYKWMPSSQQEIKGVFHLVHGSLEHAYRYKHVAEKLVQNGYVVYASDLRGHGKTVKEGGPFFYFSDQKNGWKLTVDDINLINNTIKIDYPETPIFLFGHSMGSFLVRDYMIYYGDKIEGVILSGSGVGVPAIQIAVTLFAKIVILFKGQKYKSPLLHKLVYGTLDNMVTGHQVKGDFISRDLKEVEKYQNDPFCNPTCTTQYAHDMLKNTTKINKKNQYKKCIFRNPLYIMSGGEDPVGGKGKGVKIMSDLYKKSGIKDITLKVYPDSRHELVNELNKDEVINDMISWLDTKIADRS